MEKTTYDLERGRPTVRDPIWGEIYKMSLTALEWGLRALITPRFGGELGGRFRAFKSPNQNNNKIPTLNTKIRIGPAGDKVRRPVPKGDETKSYPPVKTNQPVATIADFNRPGVWKLGPPHDSIFILSKPR